MTPESESNLANGSENSLTRARYPLSGIRRKGQVLAPFRNPYDTEYSKRMTISGKVGSWCEKVSCKVWSGNSPEVNKELISESLARLDLELRVVRRKSIADHRELARFYQALTKPVEFPFDGHERVTPEFAPLTRLFQELDSRVETDFLGEYQQLGYDGGLGLGDEDETERIDVKFRYLVEGAIIIGKVLLEPSPFESIPYPPKGILIPDVRIHPTTQLDGVFVGSDYQEKEFDFLNFLKSQKPWALLSIKVPFRPRHISGPNKIKNPIPTHVAEAQDQLGRIFVEKQLSDFNFPGYIYLIYLRGMQEHRLHAIKLDHSFFREWGEILDQKRENGHFPEEMFPAILSLRQVIRMAEEKSKKEEERNVEPFSLQASEIHQEAMVDLRSIKTKEKKKRRKVQKKLKPEAEVPLPLPI